MELIGSFLNVLHPFAWSITTLMAAWIVLSIAALIRKNSSLLGGCGVFLLVASMWSQQIVSERVAARDAELFNLQMASIVVGYHKIAADLRVEIAEDLFVQGCVGEWIVGARKMEDCFPEENRTNAAADTSAFKNFGRDIVGDKFKRQLFYFHFFFVILASLQMAFGGMIFRSAAVQK